MKTEAIKEVLFWATVSAAVVYLTVIYGLARWAMRGDRK